MGVRLRDSATVLVPASTPDPFTARPRIDWELPPAEHPVRFQGHLITDTAGALDEETTLTQWRAYFGPEARPHLTSVCRVRWDGDLYSIDGPIAKHRRGSAVRYLTATLKLVNESS